MSATETITVPAILTRAEWAKHKKAQPVEIPKSDLGKALESLEKIVNGVDWNAFSEKNCEALAKKGKNYADITTLLGKYWNPILDKCRAAIKEIVATAAYVKKKTNNTNTQKYLDSISKAAVEFQKFELEKFTFDYNTREGRSRSADQGSNEEVIKQRDLLKKALLGTNTLTQKSTNAEIDAVIAKIDHPLRDLAVSMGNAIKRDGGAPFDKALVMKAAKAQPNIIAARAGMNKAWEKYLTIRQTLLTNIEKEITELLGELETLR